MNPTDALETIKGIGEKLRDLLHKAGLFSVMDFLHDYPRDYIRVPDICDIGSCSAGRLTIVKGKILQKPYVISRKGSSFFSFSIGDGTGEVKITYFGMPYLMKNFPIGKEVILYGKTVLVKNALTIAQPKVLTETMYMDLRGKITPVYNLSSGLTNQKMMMIRDACLDAVSQLKDYLPEEYKKRFGLMDLADAVREMHAPTSDDNLQNAKNRIVFDEFLLFLLKMEMLKNEQNRDSLRTNAVFLKRSLSDSVSENLPFSLTKGQKETIEAIAKDVGSGYFMNRLVQGDVGCGKTVVAILTIFLAVENGYQAVLMAPTEVLAMQHYMELCQIIEKQHLSYNVCLLSGSVKNSEKKRIKREIELGTIQIVIGTHAVIEDDVVFQNLGLVITDEQHRFGVKQREKLMNKGNGVHTLVMSATPIPRTLGLILYGDLSVSNIRELPANRKPNKNAVMDEAGREKAYRFMQNQIQEGRQCYVICPMVEASETDDIENVTDYSEKVKEAIPAARIGIMHGRLKASEKDSLMNSFKQGELDILVSTTVIEVGVNVPNATCILIENADRFGLAQLHQLRGRVGRGEYQSYCMFISANHGKKAMDRLKVLENSNDGFVIAEEDLKRRGPGDFFGIRQSGGLHFRVADLYADAQILSWAKECAEHMYTQGISVMERIKEVLNSHPDCSDVVFHTICL